MMLASAERHFSNALKINNQILAAMVYEMHLRVVIMMLYVWNSKDVSPSA